MFLIESKNNTLFKETKKLKERKGRKRDSKFIIEGFRLIEEALKAEIKIEYIFVVHQNIEKLNEYLEILKKDKSKIQYISSIKIYEIAQSLNMELTATENPQGITAVIDKNSFTFDKSRDFYVICDKVQDPGNLGTIIRTAHAAGADGIILTKGSVDVYNDKVLRSTMGSIFYIPVIYDDENYTLIKSFKDRNYKIVSTSLQAENNFFEEDLNGKMLLVVGNEGNGVSEDVYSLSNVKVKIPMPGRAESLNVSVAASIIMYEKVRQSLK